MFISSLCLSFAALNHRLLTILGLDKAGKIHGVSLNGKTLISCEQNGEGACNVEMHATWFKTRDEQDTVTAIEVPHIPETGLEYTDAPRSPLIRKDSLGRAWGGR